MDKVISRNDPCFCGSGKKWKKCHYPHLPPLSPGQTRARYLKNYGIFVKTPQQITAIRKACRLAKEILTKLCDYAQEGITTEQLSDYASKLHQEAGASPAPLGYGSPPFPHPICTSLNEVICHGIPDQRPLQRGDILNIDVTSELDGFFGDCSAMVLIGQVDPVKRQVVDLSRRTLEEAINILEPGLPIYKIGHTIEDYATPRGMSVVNAFVGHGVGVAFHEPPQIPHHYNQIDIPLVPGMTFTIEPMINVGKRGAVIDPIDRWTARTVDGLPSAQWEHTVLITETGYEVLTC